MRLQLIRNATLKLHYGGRTLLVDPFLARRNALPSYAGHSRNPLVDLPLTIEEIVAGVELVIVSHLHSDHFDGVAKKRVPLTLPLLCQPGDETKIRAAGFSDVTPLVDVLTWRGIEIRRREGEHGSGPVLKEMGKVMGFSLEASGEPSVYWSGDTVFYPTVEETVRSFRPDVVVTHSCGAVWDGTLIVMDANQTLATLRALPEQSVVVATHMEALDHATVDRAMLRDAAHREGADDSRLLIPADGEVLEFTAHA